jgi:hypothetical protein
MLPFLPKTALNDSDRESLLARVAAVRDRLAMLSARTSSPELIERLREADAHAAALESECHLASIASASLIERLAWQAKVTEQLAADVERDV